MGSDSAIHTNKDVKVGDFVKLVDKDKQGKFSYVGEVTKLEKEVGQSGIWWIAVNSFDGEFSFAITDKNEMYVVDKPVGWDKFKKNPEAYKSGKKEKEIEREEAKAIPVLKTQKEQVFDIVKENQSLSDSKLLKLVRSSINAEDTILQNYIKLALMKLPK